MSHVVQIKTQVKDAFAAGLACERLGLATPVAESVKLFSTTVQGLAVRLPGWRYPVVFNTTTGESQFDNFEGRWGQQTELDRYLQIYAVEKAKLESRRRGYSATEQQLADGSIRVVVQVGGAA